MGTEDARSIGNGMEYGGGDNNDFILFKKNEARILYTEYNPQNVKSVKENDHTASVDGRKT